MNIGTAANLASFMVLLIGGALQIKWIFITGLFAAAGGLTNWLAVKMLFDEVPLLYGSGVVVRRFQDIKSSICNVVMSRIFTEENIKHHIEKTADSIIGLPLSGDMVMGMFPIRDNIRSAVYDSVGKLTPQDIKRVSEDMMRDHLHWLIVWGNVFGGIIGLISAIAGL
jgi:uncharacterized membrane protein YheB (UPF0754 family)